MKLRILEGVKVIEKVVTIGELMDFLQQKHHHHHHHHHHVERADSTEAKEPNRYVMHFENSGTPSISHSLTLSLTYYLSFFLIFTSLSLLELVRALKVRVQGCHR